jgi:hypothetical protein
MAAQVSLNLPGTTSPDVKSLAVPGLGWWCAQSRANASLVGIHGFPAENRELSPAKREADPVRPEIAP